MGKDKKGLGRWVYSRFRGKGNQHFRCVSAYRPCKNKEPNSTWSQHLTFFREQGAANTDPIDNFDNDFCAEIEEWIKLGDEIIIGIDMNEDVRTGKLAKRLKALGLRELILSTHSTASLPATFIRNTSRIPIEGMWGTEAIEVFREIGRAHV